MTIVCATNEGLYARCSYHPEGIKFKYQFLDPLSNQINCTESSLDETVFAEKANENDFFCYAYGTACAVLQSISDADQRQSILRNGIMIDNYKTTLPMKKGLSSSAAICVLIATAFNVVRTQFLRSFCHWTTLFCGNDCRFLPS
jgi:galactokinase